MSAGITFRLTCTGTAALLFAAACSKGGDAGAPRDAATANQAANAAPPACTTGTADLTLPAGFCATVFADSIAHARHVAVAANGDVYVTIEGTQTPPKQDAGAKKEAPAPVSFVALRDTNHDGRADIIKRIGTIGNTGIGLANGFLYVDEGKQIVRYARSDTALVPEGKREVVVSDIAFTPNGHRARNFAIGSDGALYLNVGSQTNSCQQKDRADESMGIDPCKELETRAGIWKYDANKTNQKFSAKERFATGIRNGMGIAFGPDGKLYSTQHGRDQLFANWKKLFPSPAYSANNPAEELMQVNQGDDLGWPYCYYSNDEKKLVDAPEFGGDGKKTDRCASKKAPVAAFPGHWAPMSLLFYTGNALPARYKNGAFIAFHGSWNRAPELQGGYRVVFQPLANGATSGAYETFANGFAAESDSLLQPGTAKHRPTGLAQGPDGSIFVTDDMGGRIYRITFGSGSTNAPTTTASAAAVAKPAAATARADSAHPSTATKQ